MKRIRLGVNIDHVATVRNARGENYPSPLRAAILAEKNGADSVTIHLREDRRHINEFDLILSPAMGGIIVGYELGKILNIETIFSERVNGEFKLRRGFQIKKGQKVLIVEDVITTGKSSLECSKLVKENNADIAGYACIIDRSNGKSEIKDKIISQIELNIPTYKKDNLPEELLSMVAVKPGSRNL